MRSTKARPIYLANISKLLSSNNKRQDVPQFIRGTDDCSRWSWQKPRGNKGRAKANNPTEARPSAIPYKI